MSSNLGPRHPGGRPRIPWTDSRKRKLTRLYLLTDLTIPEIGSVLTAEGFAPGSVESRPKFRSSILTFFEYAKHPDPAEISAFRLRNRMASLSPYWVAANEASFKPPKALPTIPHHKILAKFLPGEHQKYPSIVTWRRLSSTLTILRSTSTL